MRWMLWLVLVPALSVCGALRGVPPEERPLYERKDGTPLQCPPPDRPKTLAPDEINDDYCDCPLTGFDEPGTGACSSGRFYCQNAGWRPAFIPSIHVDDGHCDCCDGSDETKIRCPNRCASFRREGVRAFRKKHRIYQQAMSEKEDYLKAAQLALSETRARKRTLEELIQEQVNKLKEARSRKSKLILAKNGPFTARDVAKLGQRIGELERLLERLARNPDDRSTRSSIVAKYREYREKYASDAFDPEDKPCAEKRRADHQEDDKRHAKDKSHPSYIHESKDPKDVAKDAEFKTPHSSPVNFLPFSIWGIESILYALERFVRLIKGTTTGTTKTTASRDDNVHAEPADAHCLEDLQTLRDIIKGHKKHAKDLRDELKRLKGILRHNYGPDDVYFALSSQCYSSILHEKTYHICPYHNITVEDGGYRKTVLGYWRGWRFGEMLFERGTHCWQGPLRSATVSVVCGAKNKIVYVSERTICQFTVRFTTPAACTHAYLTDYDDDSQNIHDSNYHLSNNHDDTQNNNASGSDDDNYDADLDDNDDDDKDGDDDADADNYSDNFERSEL